MVVKSPKLEQGITLQFNSLQVQLTKLSSPPKRVLSQNYFFSELLPFLDLKNTDILAAISNHYQGNMKAASYHLTLIASCVGRDLPTVGRGRSRLGRETALVSITEVEAGPQPRRWMRSQPRLGLRQSSLVPKSDLH